MGKPPFDSSEDQSVSGQLDTQIVDDLLSLSDGDTAFVDELFDTFRVTGRECVERLRAAVQSRDLDAIGREAHSLRGTSANVGASLLQHLCAALEELSAEGQVPDSELFARIEQEFDMVCDSMERVTP